MLPSRPVAEFMLRGELATTGSRSDPLGAGPAGDRSPLDAVALIDRQLLVGGAEQEHVIEKQSFSEPTAGSVAAGRTVVAPCEGAIWLGDLTLLNAAGDADVDPYAQYTLFTVLEFGASYGSGGIGGLAQPLIGYGKVEPVEGRSDRLVWLKELKSIHSLNRSMGLHSLAEISQMSLCWAIETLIK